MGRLGADGLVANRLFATRALPSAAVGRPGLDAPAVHRPTDAIEAREVAREAQRGCWFLALAYLDREQISECDPLVAVPDGVLRDRIGTRRSQRKRRDAAHIDAQRRRRLQGEGDFDHACAPASSRKWK